MIKQRKLSKSLGKDTHTRSVGINAFQKQSTHTFEILTGEVFINQPEPAFRQNAVTVELTKGGKITGVGYPGAFIDPLTGNLHGNYEGPIPGQMVSIGFLNGNSASPIVLNKYPYQGVGNTFIENSFITPMYLAGYDCTDTLMGHFTGSAIGLYTGINPIGGRIPGEIGIDAFTDCNITAQTNILLDALVSVEIKSNIIKLNGTQITIDGSATVEINGNTKQFVTWTEFNTALQIFIIALNTAFSLKLDGIGAPAALVLDITTAKTIKTLCGG